MAKSRNCIGNTLGDFLWEKTTTDPLALFTFFLFVSTLGLWWATASGIRNQVKDTRTLQRAYISVIPRGIEQYKSLNGDLSCDVAIVNSGNLPAREVEWIIERDFDTDGKRKNFPLTKPYSGGTNIIPAKFEMRKGGDAIPSSAFDNFLKGGAYRDRWLYVWGRVNYSDGFGRRRFIKFCHRYNLLGERNWTIPESSGRHHEHGNDAD